MASRVTCLCAPTPLPLNNQLFLDFCVCCSGGNVPGAHLRCACALCTYSYFFLGVVISLRNLVIGLIVIDRVTTFEKTFEKTSVGDVQFEESRRIRAPAGSIFRPLSQTQNLRSDFRFSIFPDFALFFNLVGKVFLCGRS